MFWGNLMLTFWRFAATIIAISLCCAVNATAAHTCYDCHGSNAPPDYRPKDESSRNPLTRGFQGSHRRHMDENAGPASCETCHPGSSAYRSDHRDGIITVSPTMNGAFPQATYRNGSTAFPQRANPRLGTCTNVTCHSDGTNVATWNLVAAETPIWGSSGNSCSACHGNPPAYASGSPKANSHQKHSFNCNRCHYATTTNGTTITTPANHRNENYEVSGPPGESFYYGGACYNSYCHGNGTNVATGAAANNNTSPSWGSSGPLACNSCHGNPPAYAKSVPKANAHLMHSNQGYSCSQCHNTTTKNGTTITVGSTSHANHTYDVTGSADKPITYTFNASGGTCITYCHSTAQGGVNPADPPVYQTPKWSDSYIWSCRNCHKAGYHAFNGFAMDSGSHLKHLQFDSTSDTCRLCHYTPKYGSAGSCYECHRQGSTYFDFNTHVDTSPRGPEHANGVIDVAFLPNFPATGTTGSWQYTGDSVPGTSFGSCRNIYCHSRGTMSTAPYEFGNISTVKWGGSPLPTDCSGCHGGDANSSSPIATRSHAKHLGYDCARCHSWTVYNSRSAIPNRQLSYNYQYYATGSYHSNGRIEVAFLNKTTAVGTYAGQTNPVTPTKLPGSPPGRCTNVYCHSNGTKIATGTTFDNNSTPIWGTSGRLGCGSCHGNPPAYPDGSPKANGHLKHSADCRQCHYQTTADSTSITDRTKHAQIRYLVTPAPDIAFNYTFAATGSSCSGVSCHTVGSTPRVWGATSCGSCHLAAPADKSHKKHFTGADRYAAYGNVSSNQVFGYNCGVCHPLDPARDHDGTVQVELYNAAAPAGTVKSLNSVLSSYSSGATIFRDSMGVSYTNGTCSNIYCHSDGTSVGSTLQPTSGKVSWNSWSMYCGGNCHNYPPNYANGSPKTNSHVRHYSVGYKCQDCHYNVTTNGSSIIDKAKHVNHAYDLAPSPGKSFTFTFNATTGNSCSLISCHSDGTNIATGVLRNKSPSTTWGGATLTCASCHSNPPDYPNGSPKANSHSAHSAYACYACHSSTASQDGLYANSYYHITGQYNVTGSNMNYTYSATGGTCSSSCHSYRAATWGGPSWECTSCHGYPPQTYGDYYNPNVHVRHNLYSCDNCHFAVTNNGTSIADRAKHANGIKDVAPNGTVFSSYSANSVAGTCSNISCHGPDRKNVRWKYAQPIYGSTTDSENVPVAAGYAIAFGEDMDWSSINTDTFYIGGVPGTVIKDTVLRTATYVPTQPLKYFSVYTLNINNGIHNAAGDSIAYSNSWEFTTEKSARFVTIRTETFGTAAAPAFTWVTPSCQSGVCWSINSTGYNPFTSQTAAANPLVSVATTSSTTDARLVGGPIDLTNYRSAELKFQVSLSGYYRGDWSYAYPDLDLEVSTNGTNGPWTKVWSQSNYNSNNYGDYFYKVNLTSIASGKSNVVYRFRFYNTPTGPSTGCSMDNITLSGDMN